MKKTFIIGFGCFLLDRMIKIIIMSFMKLDTSVKVISSFFNITYVVNDGAAFSLFSSKVFFLIIVSIITLVFLIKYVIKNDLRNIEYITYGILIGGILGNLFDRIIYSSVIDYLDFNIFGYKFPIFNFADICITLSIGLIIIDMIRGGSNEDKSR